MRAIIVMILVRKRRPVTGLVRHGEVMTVYGGLYMKNKKRTSSNGPGSASFGPALSMAEVKKKPKKK